MNKATVSKSLSLLISRVLPIVGSSLFVALMDGKITPDEFKSLSKTLVTELLKGLNDIAENEGLGRPINGVDVKF